MKKTDLPDGVLRQSPRIHESAWVAPSADIIGDNNRCVVIGESVTIGAGTVIKENTRVGPNELWVGVPGRYVKTVQGNYDTHLQWAEKYVHLTQCYRGGLAAELLARKV